MRVGDLVQAGGINWYNTTSIAGKPGDQPLGDLGWSGKDTTWIEARHNLDILKGQPNVRFRIAFGSNADNAPGKVFDGFAFDDIWIGERARNVLVEHFTNTNDVNHITASNYIEQVKNTKSNIGVIDMISLEYHIAIGGDDQYNNDNNEDPSARTIVYGVQQPNWYHLQL